MIYFLVFLFFATPLVTLFYIWSLKDDRPDLGSFGGRK
jgi:hypothetical protein